MQPTCTICGEPTDTLLCLRGGDKWLTGALNKLGVLLDKARLMISRLLECEPSEVFNHRKYEDLPLFCCHACAKRGGFPAPEPVGIPDPTVLCQPDDWE
jgi:hypothetical protein